MAFLGRMHHVNSSVNKLMFGHLRRITSRGYGQRDPKLENSTLEVAPTNYRLALLIAVSNSALLFLLVHGTVSSSFTDHLQLKKEHFPAVPLNYDL